MTSRVMIMEMLFPPQCLFCGEVKPFRQECPDCVSLEQKLRLTGGDRLNYGCEHRAVDVLESVVSSYTYTEESAEMVARYKFARHYTMAREMAKIMAADVMELLGEDCCDIVLPVPAYQKRTNQHSLLIAKRVAKILDKEFADDAIIKTRDTKAQHDLAYDERGSNLSGAFAVDRDVKVREHRILLCDDVMTSGNTLNECARALRDAGALAVFAVSFSATPRRVDGAPVPAEDKPKKASAKGKKAAKK